MKRGRGGRVRRGAKQKESLAEELINEILLRLPVKSLLRFKSVCKSWLSLISDPRFAISHYELGVASTEKLMYLAPRARQYLSIDFNESLHSNSAFAALHLCFRPPKSFLYEILGSCRGFLLLICRQSLYLWNPCTGSYDTSQPQHERVARVEYFSLRANKWKELEPNLLCYRQFSNYRDNQVGCLFNGVLHWLAFRYDVLINECFRYISLPLNFVLGNLSCCHLRVLRGLFSLCAVKRGVSVEIWLMEKYKVQSSWTKTIVVSVENVPTRCFYPICSTKTGDLFGIDLATGLVKCNDKGQLQQHRSYFSTPTNYAVTVYEETLLSLPYDSKQGS
ncbi:F-box/kelch-repeat protein, partial [Mucuna pruriens]